MAGESTRKENRAGDGAFPLNHSGKVQKRGRQPLFNLETTFMVPGGGTKEMIKGVKWTDKLQLCVECQKKCYHAGCNDFVLAGARSTTEKDTIRAARHRAKSSRKKPSFLGGQVQKREGLRPNETWESSRQCNTMRKTERKARGQHSRYNGISASGKKSQN